MIPGHEKILQADGKIGIVFADSYKEETTSR